MFVPRWQRARSEPELPTRPDEAAVAAPRDLLEEHALDRVDGAEREHLLRGGLDQRRRCHTTNSRGHRPRGQNAGTDAGRSLGCPCQSTFGRTRASTPRPASSPATRSGRSTSPRHSWRTSSSGTPSAGCSGTPGPSTATPVSVQASGMGCPSAAIVIEELVQLGVKKIMRVGTCGGLQPDQTMGDMIIAVSATPADATSTHYVGDEPHAPTADFALVHEAVHQAKHLGKPVRVGPIVSSDIFYNPNEGQAQRWSDRGILAVEMEAAVLFTLGALRKIQAGCMLDRQRRDRRRRVPAHLRRGHAQGRRRDDRAGPPRRHGLLATRGDRVRRHRRLPRQPGERERLDRAPLAGAGAGGGERRARRRHAAERAAGSSRRARSVGRPRPSARSSSSSAATGR